MSSQLGLNLTKLACHDNKYSDVLQGRDLFAVSDAMCKGRIIQGTYYSKEALSKGRIIRGTEHEIFPSGTHCSGPSRHSIDLGNGSKIGFD